MKRLFILLLLPMLLLTACKKDKVDASSTKAFQESINDMASSLPTLKQIKFNEALYILKTFGVEGKNDIEKLKNLGALLEGKNVQQILSLADQVAQQNNIAWTSTGPPSLGEMNIFGDEKAAEHDPNDVSASSLAIAVNPIMRDSVNGAQTLQIVPRLLDSKGQNVSFTGAGLETILEVFNNGNKLLTAKNMMQDNNFRGFTLKLSSLPKDKIPDDKIDITVTVKTSAKTYKMSKIGVEVNPNALFTPAPAASTEDTDTSDATTSETTGTETTTAEPPGTDPKNTVSKFLGNLSSQNFKAAYDASQNPVWGSYDRFSNPTSGFGAVKNINVKNISTTSTSSSAASVNATYDVKDKEGKTTSLHVTFGLKNVNGEWKITSYKIN